MADCEKCKTKAEFCIYCNDGSEFTPQTNADRIRAMSDEELAEFLKDYHRHPCKYCIGCKVECHVGMAEWLKSEVKE